MRLRRVQKLPSNLYCSENFEGGGGVEMGSAITLRRGICEPRSGEPASSAARASYDKRCFGGGELRAGKAPAIYECSRYTLADRQG